MGLRDMSPGFQSQDCTFLGKSFTNAGSHFSTCLRMWTRLSLKSLLKALTSCDSCILGRSRPGYTAPFLLLGKMFFLSHWWYLICFLSWVLFILYNLQLSLHVRHCLHIIYLVFFYHLPNCHRNPQELAVSVFLPSINISSINEDWGEKQQKGWDWGKIQ